MGFDVRGIDHLHRRGAAAPCKRTEQSLPHSAFRPANKPIVDRLRWAIFRRTIAPPAAALDDKHDAADYPPVVHTRLATDVHRQKRLYRAPLFIAQPEKVGSHRKPNGSYAFFIRSGWKAIEFEKGKAAIAVPSLEKLPSIIDTLITAVRNGELDEQLAQASKDAKPPKAKSKHAA